MQVTEFTPHYSPGGAVVGEKRRKPAGSSRAIHPPGSASPSLVISLISLDISPSVEHIGRASMHRQRNLGKGSKFPLTPTSTHIRLDWVAIRIFAFAQALVGWPSMSVSILSWKCSIGARREIDEKSTRKFASHMIRSCPFSETSVMTGIYPEKDWMIFLNSLLFWKWKLPLVIFA